MKLLQVEVFQKMQDVPSSQPVKLEKINQILNEIKEKGNLLGVLFAYRDGDLISENTGDLIESKSFIAMCASVLGSAESLGNTVGERKVGRLIAELEDQTIMIIGCDDTTFLALILNRESILGHVFKELDNYIQKLIKNYK